VTTGHLYLSLIFASNAIANRSSYETLLFELALSLAREYKTRVGMTKALSYSSFLM
jgi:hypothetical protein